jgi:phosphopantothenoylcysteine decarboxylase
METTPAATALEFSEPVEFPSADTPAIASQQIESKSPFDSSKYLEDNKYHVLLAASGSVATIKIPNIISHLSSTISLAHLSIRLILTQSAAQFLQGQSQEQPSLAAIKDMPGVDGIYLDEDEWNIPWTRGAKILHIELRRWADVLVVAPLSANTLAKMVGGLCDNLLLSTMRAWDTTGILDVPHTVTINSDMGKSKTFPSEANKKRIIVAPAMNTDMWAHPITQRHIKVLEEEWEVDKGGWVHVLRPIEKALACGDVGGGAMCSWEKIAEVVEGILMG